MVPRGEQINQVALQLVRVLILVHEDELKAPLKMFAHVRMILQQLEPQHQQVVKIHAVGRAFASEVAFVLVDNLFDVIGKVTEFSLDQFRNRLMRVGRERKNFVQHVGLWKVFVLRVNLRIQQAGLDQILGIVAVEDGEIFLVAERVRVQPQNPCADAVKSSAPKRT